MLTNKEFFENYIQIRKDLDYIDEFEPGYKDESPNEYAELKEKEYCLRIYILHKLEGGSANESSM